MNKLIVGVSLMLCAASAGCASVIAKPAPERPTLEVPAPPTKVIDPPAKPEPAPDPVPDLPAAPPTNSPRSRPPARPPERTDPKPDPTTTATEAAPPPAPVPPAPQLRSGDAPEASEAAKQAQIAIDRAAVALKSVNYHNFPKPRRAIYDTAVLTLKSAEDALKKSDFDNAKKLAEKVETTAKELGAR